MDIKKIYTENGKVINEYFVHKEDAKEVASKLGISDDLVETLENILSTDEFIVVENEKGFSLSKDGKMVGFNIISGYLNSANVNNESTVVEKENVSPINDETMEGIVNTPDVNAEILNGEEDNDEKVDE